MNKRIRELRKELGLTKERFGEHLGVGTSAISKIESGERGVTDQMFVSICREFDVNEEWLRTGEGSMFREKSQREKAAYVVGKVLKGDDEFRQKVFIALGEILLEDGEEPALHGMSQREKAAYMVGKVLKADNEFWYKVIFNLGEMTDEEWDLIQKVVEKLK